jgi:3-dehydroquinate synthase
LRKLANNRNLILVKLAGLFQITGVSLIKRSIQVAWPLQVFFTDHVFAAENPLLRDLLKDTTPRKVLVVLEDSLAQAQPQFEHQIAQYFSPANESLRLVRLPLFLAGGERAKNSQTIIQNLYSHIYRHHLDRHSYLIAVGGGALLDIVGFAAATVHGGLRLVRLPSTTLSQADSGVGVKNGINIFGQKNFLSTYAPPFAVINDFNLLTSLPSRDKRAGYVEAVKIACIRSPAFFEEIEAAAAALIEFDPAAMRRLIRRCAELHLDHIAYANDPFESGSAHPLDFGHWAAFKLEELTSFQLAHGEAVAIGIALDVVYAQKIGLLNAPVADRILTLLERLGFPLFVNQLMNTNTRGQLAILGGLEGIREQYGTELTVPLLRDLGDSVEVMHMDAAQVEAAIHTLRERACR